MPGAEQVLSKYTRGPGGVVGPAMARGWRQGEERLEPAPRGVGRALAHGALSHPQETDTGYLRTIT